MIIEIPEAIVIACTELCLTVIAVVAMVRNARVRSRVHKAIETEVG